MKCGTNRQKQSKPIAAALRRLYRSNAPGSTYPFLMQLANALHSDAVPEKEGLKILEVIESFLVRRAVCGHEPTGLHSVFKRLWVDCAGKLTGQKVEEVIRKHKTVTWPSSADLRKAVMTRPMYGAAITQYFLEETNREAGGDQPSGAFWIEHVLPDRPSAAWSTEFKEDDHRRLKDVLANLLPLTQEMNQQLGNSSYSAKRPVYEADAGYKVTREFAKQHSLWNPAELEKRSAKLGDWAVSRWTT